MKTMKKLFLLAGMLALLLLPVQAEDSVEPVHKPAHAEEEMYAASGVGETLAAFQDWNNIQWEFDESTGTLTIQGEGSLPSYGFDRFPWAEYADQVKTVVVKEGITNLGGYSIWGERMPYEALYLPSTIEYIEGHMLRNLSLKTLTIAEGSQYYTVDNVLFCDDGETVTLVCYPGGLTNTDYAIPEGVTHIGEDAFYTRNLETLTLPDSLIGIGYVAFNSTNCIREITLPAGVSELHDAAFTYFWSLENIWVDEDNPYYTSVDGILFTKDMSLLHTYPRAREGAEYTVPDGVTKVATTTFLLPSRLQTLYLPDSVEDVYYAFGATSACSLQNIHVSETNPYLTSVDGILYDKDMTELLAYPNRNANTVYTVPETVEHIYKESFWHMAYLQTVIFNDCVSVEGYLYWGNTLTAMYFPGSVPGWLTYACRNVCDQAILYYPKGDPTWTDGSMTVDGYTYTTAAYGEGVEDTTVWNTWENIEWFYYDVAGTLKVRGTGAIPDVAYAEYPWADYRSKIKNLTVESGITDIPWGAFSGCYNLLTVKLPATLESIDTDFLANAYNLMSLQVEEGGSIYAVDNVLFSAEEKSLLLYPRSLGNTSYTVPDGILCIADNAFWGVNTTEELILPESLEKIGDRALWLFDLTTLHIPENVRYIDYDSIHFCDNLTEITVDADNPYYESVDGILFSEDLTMLVAYPMGRTAAEYTVPDTVTVMSASVYTQVRQLKKLYIPASLEEIKDATGWYGGCVLEEIVVDPDNAYFCSEDGVLYSKDMTVLYHYPACKADKEYHIPDSVTTTMTLCIYDTDYLETLYVGKNITDVRGNMVGGNLPLLTGVYLPGDFPDYFWKAFSNLMYNGNSSDRTFYYPDGAKGWETPTMTINGYTFNTAAYYPEHVHEYVVSSSVDATCTASGSVTYTCSICEDSYTETVEATGHTWGTLVIVESATVLKEGNGYYQCGNCGTKDTRTIAKLTVDANDPDYGIAYFTVIDAATLEPLENIHILIAAAKDGECTLATDAEGKAAQILPVGKQNISVYADGYQTRNLTITVAAGENQLPTIGMSTRPVVESEIIITEMTAEEIEEAGIDVTDPDNTHVFKHTVEITFTPEIDTISLDAYFNDAGEYVGGSYTPSDSDDPGSGGTDEGTPGDGGTDEDGSGEEDTGTPTPDTTPTVKDASDHKFTYPQKDGTIISVYPVSEKFYLIVYGETKWLKEMFDVEMLVVNTSGVDTLHDLEAEISLPAGLALADMVSGQQSAMVPLSQVNVNSQTSVHWYVRGDEEGTYTIDASLKGLIGAYDEEFAYTYTSDAIQVYAGEALQMNILLPYSTYYGDDYTVQIELENVSPRTLYGVRYTIPGLEQGKVVRYSNGVAAETILLTAGNDEVVQADTFLPGDKIVVEVSSNILFQSEMMEYQKKKMGEQIGAVKTMVDVYDYYSNIKEIAEFVVAFSQGAVGAIGKVVLDELIDEAMKPDAELLTAAIENIVRIASENVSAASMDTMMRLQSNELYSGLTDSLASPEQYTAYLNSLSGSHLKALAASVAVLSLQLEASDVSDVLDSIRTMVEALPVAFFVEDVLVSTLDGSTTSIPYTIRMDTTKKVQYFGIDSMDNYLRSVLIAAVGKTDEPLYQNFRIEADITDPDSAKEYLKIQKEQIAAFSAADATGETEFRMYLVSEDGQIAAEELTERFTVSCTNDTAAYSEGVLSFTGGAMLELLPVGDAGGTVCVTANEEVLATYVIDVVETHTCASDTWVIEQCQTDSYDGLRARYCDICGQTIVIEPIARCEEHVWGETVVEVEASEENDGISYQACELCGHREYAFFGYEAVIKGDITGDGNADENDLSLLRQYYSGYPVGINVSAADLDGDGKLTRADVMILARYLAGWTGYDRFFG